MMFYKLLRPEKFLAYANSYYLLWLIFKTLIHPGNINIQTITSKQSSVTPLIKGIDLTFGRVTLTSCANAINSN